MHVYLSTNWKRKVIRVRRKGASEPNLNFGTPEDTTATVHMNEPKKKYVGCGFKKADNLVTLVRVVYSDVSYEQSFPEFMGGCEKLRILATPPASTFSYRSSQKYDIQVQFSFNTLPISVLPYLFQ